jgi:tRNA threonylcarbamoyl adenosine modification protein YeaZ
LFDYGTQYIIRLKTMSNTRVPTGGVPPIILAIDTSTSEMRMALSEADRVVASFTINDGRPHSQALFFQISSLLRSSGYEIRDVSAFAAATGPGSFTGLRVGLAAIQGFADSLGKPCFGMSSIDLYALASGKEGEHWIIIEAGRGEFYCGFRNIIDGKSFESSTQDRVGAPEIISHFLKQHLRPDALIIVKSEKFDYEKWPLNLLEGLNLKDSVEGSNSVILMNPPLKIIDILARNAARYFLENELVTLKPHYIRQSDAEIKWNR